MPVIDKNHFNWKVGDPEAERTEEEERLIEERGLALHELLNSTKVSQTLVGQRVGKPPSNVSSALSGRSNMTLRTVAGVAWACRHRLVISFEPLEDTEDGG